MRLIDLGEFFENYLVASPWGPVPEGVPVGVKNRTARSSGDSNYKGPKSLLLDPTGSEIRESVC